VNGKEHRQECLCYLETKAPAGCRRYNMGLKQKRLAGGEAQWSTGELYLVIYGLSIRIFGGAGVDGEFYTEDAESTEGTEKRALLRSE
jgi:hypothetical protein